LIVQTEPRDSDRNYIEDVLQAGLALSVAE
jgi:hypothetical protein